MEPKTAMRSWNKESPKETPQQPCTTKVCCIIHHREQEANKDTATEEKPIHPFRFLLAFVITFVIISIIPCLLLFISTIVAGPATVDATPDLFDMSTG
jgi:hypothetical protein